MSRADVERRLKEKLDAHVARKANRLRNLIVEGVPVDTGRLKQSIGVQKVQDGEYRVGTNVDYAPYVEFGTRRQAPQPFMRPAIERLKSEDGGVT